MPRPKVRPEDRQRSYRACLPCKASKIRCDAQHPCSSCLRRAQASSCTYSGVDRRRKSDRDLPRVRPGTKEPQIFVNVTPSSESSSIGAGIPMGTPSSVERVTPDISSQAGTVNTTVNEEETYTSGSSEKVYMGETSSLSFLHFLRRTVKSYIGSVPFTDGEGYHVTIDTEDSRFGSVTPIGSLETTCALVDSYFEATSGVLDLFTEYEIDTLLSKNPPSYENSTPQSVPITGEMKALFDLVLAIGAQTRGIGDDLRISRFYFLRARATAFDGMLMTQTLNTVRTFILLAFYTLGACNRNAASMFLGIAAKAAVILGLYGSEHDGTLSKEEVSIRKRIWNSVQNLDVLSSFISGRPKSSPAVCHGVPQLAVFDSANGTYSPPLFNAMANACILLDDIVNTLGKSNNILHIPTAEMLLKQLREWSQGLPQHTRRFPFVSDTNGTLESEDRRALLGGMHISCVYYFAVILVTRPFLVAYLLSRLRGKAPDHLISDPEEASDINIKNNKVSRLAQVCVNSAIEMVDMCVKAKSCKFLFRNFCLLEAWVFGAGLVLGFSVFAGEPRKDIDDAFHNAHIILGDIALTSPQARLYHSILTSFGDAVKKYKQRVIEERNYTVRHYMDRILTFEPATDQNNAISREGFSNLLRGSDDAWQSYLAASTHPQTLVDSADLPANPTAHPPASEIFEQEHNDWLDGGLRFLDCFLPELEPFDQLFYTVE